jgi:hypothetical protein
MLADEYHFEKTANDKRWDQEFLTLDVLFERLDAKDCSGRLPAPSCPGHREETRYVLAARAGW